ncbi:MAG TPA: diguanylate cyclase [Gammaproteobacteria bacterium]|nr:diguanylate cyclase [Gammaproteobacteria bacterium]
MAVADVTRELELLRASYAQRLPERVSELRTLWSDALEHPSPQALRQLRQLLHGLAGSGASFGFPEVSDAARRAEQELDRCLEGDGALDDPARTRVPLELARLEAAAGKASATRGAAVAATPEALSVAILERDRPTAEALARQLEQYRLRVAVTEGIPALRERAREAPPDALIADIGYCDARHGPAMRELMARLPRPVPIFYLSDNDGIEERLRAVRAYGKGFFTRPVDVDELLRRLERVAGTARRRNYRVLIVDDDAETARLHALTLERAALRCRTLTEPLRVLEALAEFDPDIMLMDLHMPACTGPELAAVIRQQSRFTGLPIVYLSGEARLDRQLAALRAGGDDFLVKPVDASTLVTVVMSSAERSRAIRDATMHDGLTGALNHTHTQARLHVEVARAQRYERPLTIAILDIDHFKAINDSYGHPAGDRVLRSLARLLRQRLRLTDVVGRIGGEEFMVILTDTPAELAVPVLNDLRSLFAAQLHAAGMNTFQATFSAGVAALPRQGGTAQVLEDAADHALYEAKRAGRNRVVLSPLR